MPKNTPTSGARSAQLALVARSRLFSLTAGCVLLLALGSMANALRPQKSTAEKMAEKTKSSATVEAGGSAEGIRSAARSETGHAIR